MPCWRHSCRWALARLRPEKHIKTERGAGRLCISVWMAKQEELLLHAEANPQSAQPHLQRCSAAWALLT